MTNQLKAAALAVTLAFAANATEASPVNTTCDADFAYNVDIDGDNLSFSSKDQQKVLIESGQSLYLDGEKQSLSPAQLKLVQEYNQQVRELLPAASGIAEEASAIALEVVGAVTAALLADNPEKSKEFMAKVESISAGLKQHISNSHLRPQAVEDYLESSDFEAEFEALIESAVGDFIENNVAEMVAAAMSGNEEKVKAFEQRMEQFGKDMETKFEARGELLEAKAEELCQMVNRIDLKEADLVKALSEFDKYQLITE